jgi:hypothetical protein
MVGSEEVRDDTEADGWLSMDDSVLDRPSIRFVSFVGVAFEAVSSFGFPGGTGKSSSSGATLRRLASLLSSSLGEFLCLVGAFLA